MNKILFLQGKQASRESLDGLQREGLLQELVRPSLGIDIDSFSFSVDLQLFLVEGVAPVEDVAASDIPPPGGNASEAASVHPLGTSTFIHNRSAKTFRAYLPDCHRTYSCIHCRAHLANHDELISKSFQGSQGRAYLFNSVVNIRCGQAEERVLLTGLHAVADIYCDCCKATLGWKYEQAYESSQKYKEGKYIIELAHMIKDNGWDIES